MSHLHLQKIAIVGASGTLGSLALQNLLSDSKASITCITRTSSTSTFPDGVTIKKGDYADPAFLESALQGQDALVLILGLTAMDTQFAFVEAAAKADVKWIVPTEFAGDTGHDELVEKVPFLQLKREVRRKIEEAGMNWIGLITNQWLDYSVKEGLFDIDVKAKTATIYDDSAKFNTTSLPTAALALSRLLSLPLSGEGPSLNGFANKLVYVASAFISQPEIFVLVKTATGISDDEWKITHASYEDRLARGDAELKKGNPMGMVDLVYGLSMKPGKGGDYGVTKGLDNDALGLEEPKDLVEVVKAGL